MRLQQEVHEYLKRLNELLSDSDTKLYIKFNRDKNANFMYLYRINKNYIVEVLRNLKDSDFEKKVNSNNSYHEGDVLYIFSPTLSLTSTNGTESIVKLYIKIHVNYDDKIIVVISFHDYGNFD